MNDAVHALDKDLMTDRLNMAPRLSTLYYGLPLGGGEQRQR